MGALHSLKTLVLGESTPTAAERKVNSLLLSILEFMNLICLANSMFEKLTSLIWYGQHPSETHSHIIFNILISYIDVLLRKLFFQLS